MAAITRHLFLLYKDENRFSLFCAWLFPVSFLMNNNDRLHINKNDRFHCW